MTPEMQNGPAAQQARSNVSTLTRTNDPARVTRLDDIRPAQLQAWASACYHLINCGLTPLPPSHVVAALRRRGWWSLQ